MPFFVALVVTACGETGPIPHDPVAPPPLPPRSAAAVPGDATAPTIHIAEEGLIADFEVIGQFNAVGGRYGAWRSSAPDPEADCVAEVLPGGEGGGSSLRISYDISRAAGPKTAYAGLWMHLNDFDASRYTHFCFSARAEDAGPEFHVELKDQGGKNTARTQARSITSDWTRVEIPLTQFEEIKDWRHLHELTIVFDHAVSAQRKGAYRIDNIHFR